ncbi:hypothetical protein TNCV_1319631 [Trichonephila clavipes]|nr:hypothetical protein TNCV_1319631 [Trichonephila clavipes]
MVYGGRPAPIQGRRSSSHVARHIAQNSKFFREYNRKKLLTVEIISIIISLRLSREGEEAAIGAEARDQLSHALRCPSLHIEIMSSTLRNYSI